MAKLERSVRKIGRLKRLYGDSVSDDAIKEMKASIEVRRIARLQGGLFDKK